jgi:hypothetical protein
MAQRRPAPLAAARRRLLDRIYYWSGILIATTSMLVALPMAWLLLADM